MSIKIHTLSAATPDWVETVIRDYSVRLSGRWALDIQNTRRQNRGKHRTNPGLLLKESEQLLSKIPQQAYVIALDEQGTRFESSHAFAEQLHKNIQDNPYIHFILGGPEGLTQPLRERAHMLWSLSGLTFTHTLAQVVLCEQIYRAWSIVHHHPYHNS